MSDVRVSLTIEPSSPLGLAINTEPATLGLAVTGEYIDGGTRTYEGPYEVTPSAIEQVLSTQYLKMAQDVIINPIPNNYGLISWNGAVLTVS